ncbi:cytochrome P450 [Sphaerosporella brunnea]|uniref:Cytochrome P450 n=1 Tax=Sphaerosporella brunnea TaxID=1250544 RepID=A0A5J5ELD5_9PEZI|nr:cytochrome P450 [Sphaerosporella brunnea]
MPLLLTTLAVALLTVFCCTIVPHLRRLHTILHFIKTKQLPLYPGTLYAEHNSFTIPFPIPGKAGLLTAEPECIKTMMSSEFKNVGVSLGRAPYTPLLGAGLFIQDGARWSHPRSLLRPLFTRSAVSSFALLESLLQPLFAHVLAAQKSGEAIDLEPLFQTLTLDLTTAFLLGEPAGEKGKEFADALEEGMKHVNFSLQLGRFWWVWRPRGFTAAIRQVEGFVEHYLRRNSSGAFVKTLLDAGESEQQVRAHVLNTLFAGRDSTAATLSWVVWNLVRRRDIAARVRAEIADVVGDALPTVQALAEMKFFRAVLNETLRLHPPVPLTNREPLGPTVILPGKAPIRLKQGEPVYLDFFTLHRRQDLWGDDAAAFRPERWGENEQFEREMTARWCFLPFGLGGRSCLGQQLAINTVMYTIVRLSQKVGGLERVVKTQEDGDQVRFTNSPVPAPGEGVWVALKE